MRTLTISIVVIVLSAISIFSQDRFDIAPILPGDHSTDFNRIYKNLPKHVPVNEETVSSDTHTLIYNCEGLTLEEHKAWDNEVILEKKVILISKTDKFIAKLSDEKLQKELMMMKDSPNYKNLVLQIKKDLGRDATLRQVKKHFGWSNNNG